MSALKNQGTRGETRERVSPQKKDMLVVECCFMKLSTTGNVEFRIDQRQGKEGRSAYLKMVYILIFILSF